MAIERKGVQGIRTMAALIDSRRARTAAGALLEMSAMANEKLLLQKELKRWARRHREIEFRLREIAAKEERLMALVQVEAGPQPSGPPSPAGTPPIESAIIQRMKVKEFTY